MASQTGAAQLVEVRETVREIIVPRYVVESGAETSVGAIRDASVAEVSAPPAPQIPRYARDDTRAVIALFDDTPEWLFLRRGVPPEWIDGVQLAME